MENKLVEQVNKETIAGLNHCFNNLLGYIPSDASYLIKECESRAIKLKIKKMSDNIWKIHRNIKDNFKYITKEIYETPEEQIKAILGKVYSGINKKVENVLNLSTEIKKHIKSGTEEEEVINKIINSITEMSDLLEGMKGDVPYKTEVYSPTINMLILPKPNKNQ